MAVFNQHFNHTWCYYLKLFEFRGKDIQRITIIPSQKLVVTRFGYTPSDAGWDHEAFIQPILTALKLSD